METLHKVTEQRASIRHKKWPASQAILTTPHYHGSVRGAVKCTVHSEGWLGVDIVNYLNPTKPEIMIAGMGHICQGL